MSQTSIINKALSLLGANRITSTSDDSLEAQCASNIYNDSLRSILTECNWHFAQKKVMLPKVDKEPAWVKNGMRNYFQLPSDLVLINEIAEPNAIWEIEGDMVLANSSVFGLEYTAFVADSSKYPAYFEDAFVVKLAADMCYEITNSNEKTMSLLELYKGEYLPLAKAKNARECSAPQVNDNYWVDSVYRSFYG